jgi:Zn-dependent peptidase ImmA (M78 family)/DNA-binding XRE family transcriptional regulator
MEKGMTVADNGPIVVPRQLKFARETLALSRQDVASRLNFSEQELAAWEDGLAEPSVEVLWSLADLYGRDVDYFVRDYGGIPSTLNFRLTAPHRLEELTVETRHAIAEFDELCRSARQVEAVLELPRWKSLPSYSGVSGDQVAERERRRLGLGDRPVPNIRALVESQRVLCFHLAVPGNEFSGLSWIHPRYGPSILVKAGDNPGRRAFTTAHEYGHLLRRDGDSVCDIRDLDADMTVEKQANLFATSFLMPAWDVLATFRRRGLSPDSVGVSDLASLARRYSVSLEAMRIRLKELNLASEEVLQLWLDLPPSKYFGRARPKWRRRLGETVVTHIMEAHAKGQISTGKLAAYLGMDIRQAMDLVERETAGARPPRG